MSDGFGLILPSGLQQFDFVETYPLFIAGGTNSIQTNAVYLTRVRLAKAITVSKMTYVVGTASGNVNLGIYTYDVANDTYALIASTPSTAAAGSSTEQTIDLSAAVALSPGVDYAFAFQADNNTITAERTSVTYAAYKKRVMIKTGGSFGLAANQTSIASAAATSGAVWVGAGN